MTNETLLSGTEIDVDGYTIVLEDWLESVGRFARFTFDHSEANEECVWICTECECAVEDCECDSREFTTAECEVAEDSLILY